MAEKFTSILDLVEASPPDPAALKKRREEVWEIENTLKQAMDRGLTPADMVRARALRAAAEAAGEVADFLRGR